MTALSALVDQLMGKDRNAGPNEKRSEIRWDTEDVCKHYLCGFCPAELFTNTRSDLGMCSKSHDERAKKAYEKSSKYMKMGYEEEFLRYLQQCWQEVERRIRRNHQRLQLSEEKSKMNLGGNTETDEKIKELNDRITKMLKDIEELGGQGEVAQAQAMNKVCEQLKEEREQLQSQKGGIMDQFSVQEKQMEVCEVCGAFLIVGDAQSRVDDHLMGKQHMGYAKIKAAIAELKDKLTEGPPARLSRNRSPERNGENRSRRSPRESSRDKDRKRDRSDRYRRSSRERSSHRRSSRERKRSSSRGRHKSSHSDRHRDRRHRSRDRSRRDSSRERRSRDRSSRKKRSRDRDRSRSRDRERKRSKRSRSRDRSRKSSSKQATTDESNNKSNHSEKNSEENNKTAAVDDANAPAENPLATVENDHAEGEKMDTTATTTEVTTPQADNSEETV